MDFTDTLFYASATEVIEGKASAKFELNDQITQFVI